MTKAIEFADLEVGQRIVVSITTKDPKDGSEDVGYFLGEIEDLKKKGSKVIVLLDDKDSKGKKTSFPVGIDDVYGFVDPDLEECGDELSEKQAKKYLADEKSSGKSDKDADDDKKPAGKSDKPGKKGPPKETDNGPDLTTVPKYAAKKAEVGDRIVVDHFYDGNKVFAGIYKGTVNAELEDGHIGILYDSGGSDADGWVKPEWVMGRATERAFKKKIAAEKVLQHLVGKDGKTPLEAPPESPFTNNKERFDSLDAQILELKEIIEKLTKKIEKIGK